MSAQDVVYGLMSVAIMPLALIPTIVSFVRKVDNKWLIVGLNVVLLIGLYQLFHSIFCMVSPPMPWDQQASAACKGSSINRIIGVGCLPLYILCLMLSLKLKSKGQA